jgi:hypothetical protein
MAGNVAEIVLRLKDEVTKNSQKIQGSFDNIGGSIKKLAGLALGGLGLAAMTKGVMDLAREGAMLSATTQTFDNLSESIDTTSDALLIGLREATGGMVDDATLMQGANKLMAMGLAGTRDEAGKLAGIAVQLGQAMGVDAATALSDFGALLANQSIPRLDNFGISSGKVRERIDELTTSLGLSREEAFKMAVMEEGAKAIEKIGDMSETAAGRTAQFDAKMKNVKDTMAKALTPVMDIVVDVGGDLADILAENIDLIAGFVEGLANVIGGLAKASAAAIRWGSDIINAHGAQKAFREEALRLSGQVEESAIVLNRFSRETRGADQALEDTGPTMRDIQKAYLDQLDAFDALIEQHPELITTYQERMQAAENDVEAMQIMWTVTNRLTAGLEEGDGWLRAYGQAAGDAEGAIDDAAEATGGLEQVVALTSEELQGLITALNDARDAAEQAARANADNVVQLELMNQDLREFTTEEDLATEAVYRQVEGILDLTERMAEAGEAMPSEQVTELTGHINTLRTRMAELDVPPEVKAALLSFLDEAIKDLGDLESAARGAGSAMAGVGGPTGGPPQEPIALQHGGIVPGPAGMPRLIIGHSGEEYKGAPGTTYNINYYGGAAYSEAGLRGVMDLHRRRAAFRGG